MNVVLPAPFGPMMPCTWLGAKRERDVVDGDEAAEGARQALDVELLARLGAAHAAARGGRARGAARPDGAAVISPAMPRGAPSTAAIRMTPSASDQCVATGPTQLSVLRTSSRNE